jgi:hypothetical protein
VIVNAVTLCNISILMCEACSNETRSGIVLDKGVEAVKKYPYWH